MYIRPGITWLVSVTIYIIVHFSITINSHPPRQSLRKKIFFNRLGGMLIEQIFELRRPNRPPGRTCSPKTGYFHDKTNISKENLRVDLLLKYCRKQCTSIPYFTYT